METTETKPKPKKKTTKAKAKKTTPKAPKAPKVPKKKIKKNRFRPTDTYRVFHELFDEEEPKTLVFCDTETDGVNYHEDHVLEWAGIKMQWNNGKLYLVDSVDIFIQNTRPIPEGASKVNHITEETLVEKNAVPESEAYQKIKAFMKGADVFLAYNEPFDFGMTSSLFGRNGDTFKVPHRLDVMAMCIDLYPNTVVPIRTLKGFVNKFGIDKGNLTFHDARADIEMTAKVFEVIYPMYKEYEPLDTFPGAPVPEIKDHWFWANPKRYGMTRVYFFTNYGQIYFEQQDRSLGINDKKCTYHLDELDLDTFLKNALKYLHLETIEELAHLKEEPKPSQPQVMEVFSGLPF